MAAPASATLSTSPSGIRGTAGPSRRACACCCRHASAPRATARAASTVAAALHWAFLGLLGVAFWIAIFVFFYRALRYFLSVPEFGPVLTYKLLGMVFLTFFSILLFSNIITALSTFFLSRELDRLVAAPVSRSAVLLRALRRHDDRVVVDGAGLRRAGVPGVRHRTSRRAALLPGDRADPAAVSRDPGGPRRGAHRRAGQRVSGAADARHSRAAVGGGDRRALSALPHVAAGAPGESGGVRELRRVPRRHADTVVAVPAEHVGGRDPVPAAQRQQRLCALLPAAAGEHGGGADRALRGADASPLPPGLEQGAGRPQGALHAAGGVGARRYAC